MLSTLPRTVDRVQSCDRPFCRGVPRGTLNTHLMGISATTEAQCDIKTMLLHDCYIAGHATTLDYTNGNRVREWSRFTSAKRSIHTTTGPVE